MRINLTADYGPRGVVYDPITGTALALTAAGAAVSASGTLGAGRDQEYAGILKAQTAVKGSEMVASAQETGGELQAEYTEAAGEQMAKAKTESGDLALQAAEFKAKQSDLDSMDATALAQRKAMDARRDTKFALSTLQARAAASGGGASDRTVQNIAKEIAGRGEYQALTMMFAGEDQARGYDDIAKAARFTGAAQKYGADTEAATALWQSKALAGITRYQTTAQAAATRFSGQSTADASMFAGQSANNAAQTSAMGTLLGGAGSMFKMAGGSSFGGGGGSSFMPSSSFVNNQWGW